MGEEVEQNDSQRKKGNIEVLLIGRKEILRKQMKQQKMIDC